MDNQQLFASILSECLAEHKMTWFEYACNDKGLNPNDVDYADVSDVLETKYVEPDLIEKGFTKKEAQEISLQQISEKTALKFMAYFVSLYEEYENYEEFVQIINEDMPDFGIKNLPEKTLQEIFLSAHELKWLDYVEDEIEDTGKDDV